MYVALVQQVRWVSHCLEVIRGGLEHLTLQLNKYPCEEDVRIEVFKDNSLASFQNHFNFYYLLHLYIEHNSSKRCSIVFVFMLYQHHIVLSIC